MKRRRSTATGDHQPLFGARVLPISVEGHICSFLDLWDMGRLCHVSSARRARVVGYLKDASHIAYNWAEPEQLMCEYRHTMCRLLYAHARRLYHLDVGELHFEMDMRPEFPFETCSDAMKWGGYMEKVEKKAAAVREGLRSLVLANAATLREVRMQHGHTAYPDASVMAALVECRHMLALDLSVSEEDRIHDADSMVRRALAVCRSVNELRLSTVSSACVREVLRRKWPLHALAIRVSAPDVPLLSSTVALRSRLRKLELAVPALSSRQQFEAYCRTLGAALQSLRSLIDLVILDHAKRPHGTAIERHEAEWHIPALQHFYVKSESRCVWPQLRMPRLERYNNNSAEAASVECIAFVVRNSLALSSLRVCAQYDDTERRLGNAFLERDRCGGVGLEELDLADFFAERHSSFPSSTLTAIAGSASGRTLKRLLVTLSVRTEEPAFRQLAADLARFALLSRLRLTLRRETVSTGAAKEPVYETGGADRARFYTLPSLAGCDIQGDLSAHLLVHLSCPVLQEADVQRAHSLHDCLSRMPNLTQLSVRDLTIVRVNEPNDREPPPLQIAATRCLALTVLKIDMPISQEVAALLDHLRASADVTPHLKTLELRYYNANREHVSFTTGTSHETQWIAVCDAYAYLESLTFPGGFRLRLPARFAARPLRVYNA